MKKDTVYVKKYTDIKADNREILRYMCCNCKDENIESIISECLSETEKNCVFNYSVCYRLFDIKITEKTCDLGFAVIDSADLSKNLADCSEIVLFAATCGIGIDRLISKYNRISPVKALCMQAIGTEHAEKLCDAFEKEIKEDITESGCTIKPRYSPGYGDVSIELQRKIFEVLQCNSKAGISLSENLLMTPTKSVTAIIGIKKEETK